MRVLVLGGGVIGVTAAHYLAEAGHEVEVVDRRCGPALETSFANAGQVSSGYASPWASPGVPVQVLRWLLIRHSPLVLRPKLDPAMWLWLARMLRNCTPARYATNKERMVRLAEFSRDCLRALRANLRIAYDERSSGTLQLFRTEQQVVGAERDISVLQQFEVPFELLDPEGCVTVEPALAQVRDTIAGGLRLADDETGDCHLFTGQLAKHCARQGVRFRFGTTIRGLCATGDKVESIETSEGLLRADAYVVALGSYSPLLLSAVGINIPVYPVKGYSLTIPITDPASAPLSTVMDETFKIAITRLGDRIRVGGTAEISGYDLSRTPARRRALEHSVRELFPRGGDLHEATFWCGLRPMTPDGPPVSGRTQLHNLYINSGHGTLGWTMACGSGKVIADLISGRRPDIFVDDLSETRYAE
ncbi:MAG: D-amino acid dehydrogenase [Dehalococcoidia bacterium]